jgi:hypothetical protein
MRFDFALVRGCNAQNILEADGVLYESCREGFLQGAQLTLVQGGREHLNVEIPEMQGPRRWHGFDRDLQLLAGEPARAQILRHALANASSQRNQQKLGWRHALVGSSVLGGLVQHDSMVARLRREAGAASMLHKNLQR